MMLLYCARSAPLLVLRANRAHVLARHYCVVVRASRMYLRPRAHVFIFFNRGDTTKHIGEKNCRYVRVLHDALILRAECAITGSAREPRTCTGAPLLCGSARFAHVLAPSRARIHFFL